MSFSEIFLPLFCALCAWSVFLEVFSFGFKLWSEKRHAAKYKEMQEAIAKGETPAGFLDLFGFDPLGLGELNQNTQVPENPNISTEQSGTGQYL